MKSISLHHSSWAGATRQGLLVGLLLASFALTACTARFRDDIEKDPIGSPPLSSPAGKPKDKVHVETQIGGIAYVSDQDPLSGARSLILSDEPLSKGFLLVFVTQAEPLARTDRDVYISWSGRLAPGTKVRVGLRPVQEVPSKLLFDLVIGESSIAITSEAYGSVNCPGTAQDGPYDILGSFDPGKDFRHTVNVAIQPRVDAVGFRITGAKSDINVTCTWKKGAIWPLDFTSDRILALAFEVTNAASHPPGGHFYQIDDILVMERN